MAMNLQKVEEVPTIPTLFTGISADIQKLFRQEKALLAAEMEEKITMIKAAAMLLGVVSALFLSAMALLSMGAFHGLRLAGFADWAAYLTVGTVYLAVGLFVVFKRWR